MIIILGRNKIHRFSLYTDIPIYTKKPLRSGGGKGAEQGYLRCSADVTNLGYITSAMQATLHQVPKYQWRNNSKQTISIDSIAKTRSQNKTLEASLASLSRN